MNKTNYVTFDCCDSCFDKRIGVMYHSNGTPELFQCVECGGETTKDSVRDYIFASYNSQCPAITMVT